MQQQRQLRLGDILDDYCPRERRLTNHAVVAMVGADVKQTRCTTCDAEHEYKHAKVPRQRRKSDTPAALFSQVLAGGPKRVAGDAQPELVPDEEAAATPAPAPPFVVRAARERSDGDGSSPLRASAPALAKLEDADVDDMLAADPLPADPSAAAEGSEEGPVHRPLIRATLPRIEGQAPQARPAPDFTIRQPAGRQGRFRSGRPPARAAGQPFHGNRSNGNVPGGMRGTPRQPGQRHEPHAAKRHSAGRKRSK